MICLHWAVLLSRTSHVLASFGCCRSEVYYDTQPHENGIDMKRAAKSCAFCRTAACVILANVTSPHPEASAVAAGPSQAQDRALDFWQLWTTTWRGSRVYVTRELRLLTAQEAWDGGCVLCS